MEMAKAAPKKRLFWRVRVLMAERGIRSVSELSRKLALIGVDISISQLGRLIDNDIGHWNKEAIEGLMDVLECEIGELFQSR
jgi:DNA-binding Xre family transcriptional regulator